MLATTSPEARPAVLNSETGAIVGGCRLSRQFAWLMAPEPGSYMPSREPAVETALRSGDLSGEDRHHGTTARPDAMTAFTKVEASELLDRGRPALLLLVGGPPWSGSPRLSSPRRHCSSGRGCSRLLSGVKGGHDLLWLRAEFT